MARLVIPPHGRPAGQPDAAAAPPSLHDVSIVFGVADAPDAAPTDADFVPVYRVSMPVFGLSALDPDGVHEFDARALLDDLARRATRRRWGARVELVVSQPAAAEGVDLWLEAPDVAGPLSAPDPRGIPQPGGGRRVLFRTRVVAPADLAHLAGTYTAGAGDRPTRPLILALDRYEFEP